MTINEFFYKLTNDEISPNMMVKVNEFEQIKHVELSKSTNSEKDELQSDNSSEYQNGFDIIMRSAWSIPNIANWIQRHEGGWSTQKLADSEGKQFIIALSEVLWHIDIHDSIKLEERSFHIPNLFYEFLGKANLEFYKESRKPFDASELNLHCQTLILYTTSTWIREVPIRSIEKATSVNIYDRNIWINSYIKSKYKEIEAVLQNLPPWKLLSLEEYLPTELIEAKLVQETMRITSELQNDVPQYHTRIMRANYLYACDLLLPNIKLAPLRTIYRMLTGNIEIAESNPTLKAELIKSIQDPINLVREVFERQSIKEEPFRTFDATTDKNIKKFWENISLANTKHYFFTIKKCGKIKCPICSPPRSPPEIFSRLFHLPDLVPGEDLYYKPFNELYGSLTTENANKLSDKNQQILEQFLDTILYTCRTAFHNTRELLLAMPVVLFEQHHEIDKTPDELNCNNNEVESAPSPSYSYLEQEINDEGCYSDQSDQSDQEENMNKIDDSIQEIFKLVFVNDSWTCASPIEKLYYSAKIYPPFCYLCGSLDIKQSTTKEEAIIYLAHWY
ncbi:40448_t:CDS:10 [Gigaspora margarita]|uniref:40448_t:CDS:1 n=1 Tax=Gigaspora margarita TaxID=4874 RepID=A0ABM8VXI5_GIGMA|nr:40448_t:CDS:10 [Gigaspora margarita]